jgi:hypothetical protein
MGDPLAPCKRGNSTGWRELRPNPEKSVSFKREKAGGPNCPPALSLLGLSRTIKELT